MAAVGGIGLPRALRWGPSAAPCPRRPMAIRWDRRSQRPGRAAQEVALRLATPHRCFPARKGFCPSQADKLAMGDSRRTVVRSHGVRRLIVGRGGRRAAGEKQPPPSGAAFGGVGDNPASSSRQRPAWLPMPCPSVSVTSRSTSRFSNTSTPPPIQRTSTRSTRSRFPKPK